MENGRNEAAACVHTLKHPISKVALDLSYCWFHLFVVALSSLFFCFALFFFVDKRTFFAPFFATQHRRQNQIIERKFSVLDNFTVEFSQFIRNVHLSPTFAAALSFLFVCVCLSYFIAYILSLLLTLIQRTNTVESHRKQRYTMGLILFPSVLLCLSSCASALQQMFFVLILLLAAFHVVWQILTESNIRTISGIYQNKIVTTQTSRLIVWQCTMYIYSL